MTEDSIKYWPRVFTKWCTFKSKSIINKFSDNKIRSKTKIQFNKAESTLFLSNLPGNRLAGYLNCRNKGPEDCTSWSAGPSKYSQGKGCRKISVEIPLFKEAITPHLNRKQGMLCIWDIILENKVESSKHLARMGSMWSPIHWCWDRRPMQSLC